MGITTATLTDKAALISPRKMPNTRPVYSRPRTKVYETNYNIGESYYRPALDNLDRKYGGRYGSFGGPSANGDVFGMRAPPPPPAPLETPAPTPRSTLRDMEDDEFFSDAPRRRPNSALLGEFDAILEGRMMRNGMSTERTSMRSGRTLDDEFEDDITSSMKRLRAVKAARSFADDLEDMESSFKKDVKNIKRLEFSDKVMDSVGLSGRARAALEDEGSTLGRRRFLRMTSDPEGEELTKWTAIRPPTRRQMMEQEDENTMVTSGAAARARQSRARLEDLESEMQALSEKSAAREKRVRDLRALVQENEASSLDNLQTTVRVKSSIQSEKKTMAY